MWLMFWICISIVSIVAISGLAYEYFLDRNVQEKVFGEAEDGYKNVAVKARKEKLRNLAASAFVVLLLLMAIGEHESCGDGRVVESKVLFSLLVKLTGGDLCD